MKVKGHYYVTSTDIPLQETERWDELIDWMEERRRHYAEILDSVRGRDRD